MKFPKCIKTGREAKRQRFHDPSKAHFTTRVAMIGLLVMGAFVNVASAEGSPTNGTPATSTQPIPIMIVTPSPAASASAAPSPVIRVAVPTLYVMALSGDATTNAKLTIEGAAQARVLLNPRYSAVSAPPTWLLSDFAGQCNADPLGTLGALVVIDASSQAGTISYLALSHGWNRMDAEVLLYECTLSGAAVNIWGSGLVHGTDGQDSATLAPLSLIASAVQSFFTAHGNSTTTTVTYPSPAPFTKPYTSEQQTTSSRNALSQNTAGSEAAALGLGVLGSFSNANGLTIPGINTDPLIKNSGIKMVRAALTLLGRQYQDLAKDCSRCGDWFAPFTYSTAKPSAALADLQANDPSSVGYKVDTGSLKAVGAYIQEHGGYTTSAMDDGYGGYQAKAVAYSVTVDDSSVTISEIDTFPRFDLDGTSLCSIRRGATTTYTFVPSRKDNLGFVDDRKEARALHLHDDQPILVQSSLTPPTCLSKLQTAPRLERTIPLQVSTVHDITLFFADSSLITPLKEKLTLSHHGSL